MSDTQVIVTQVGAGTITIEDVAPTQVASTDIQPTVVVDNQTSQIQVTPDTPPTLVLESQSVPITLTEESTDVVEVFSAGPQGPAGFTSFQTIHAYVIGDTISVDTLPAFFFFKLPSQTSFIKKAVHKIGVGTSATVTLKKNGSAVSGYTGLSVTQTKTTTTAAAVTMADEDELSLQITAISGSPQDLTFTIVIEHTIS